MARVAQLPPPALDRLVFSRCPDYAGRLERARYLRAFPDRGKNEVVLLEVGGERFVLKVFFHRLRYQLQVWSNPISRYLTRAFTLRSGVAERIRSEVDGMHAYRSAGFGTFEIVDRPAPDALLYRHERGGELLGRIQRNPDRAFVRDVVRRLSEDLRTRQDLAVETGTRALIHPDPRIQHVFLTDDGRFLYHDFEGRVNPELPLDEALGREVESFFHYLQRLDETSDPRLLELALDVVGEDAIARWEALPSRWTDRLNQSSRKRRGLLSRLRSL